MNPLERDQVISAFPTEDREALSLPALDRLDWRNLDFLGWCDRSGDKAFLAFEEDGETSGLRLDRMRVHTSNARSFICSICRTMHGARGIANFTYHAKQGTGYHTLTDLFCGDLQCSLYVRGLLKPDIMQFHETISVDRKIERLLTGIDQFRANITRFDSRRRERPHLRLISG